MPVTLDTNDTFIFREEPFVEVEDELGFPSFLIMLRNFALNSSAVRPEHMEIMRDLVAPYVQRPAGVAEIYAMADRSGDIRTNYKVSGARLAEVQRQIVGFGTAPNKVFHAFAKAVGEDFAESKQVKNGSKDKDHRIVAIGLTPGPIGIPTRRFRQEFARELLAFGRLHQQRAV